MCHYLSVIKTTIQVDLKVTPSLFTIQQVGITIITIIMVTDQQLTMTNC
jgi:hypothetical protein